MEPLIQKSFTRLKNIISTAIDITDYNAYVMVPSTQQGGNVRPAFKYIFSSLAKRFGLRQVDLEQKKPIDFSYHPTKSQRERKFYAYKCNDKSNRN